MVDHHRSRKGTISLDSKEGQQLEDETAANPAENAEGVDVDTALACLPVGSVSYWYCVLLMASITRKSRRSWGKAPVPAVWCSTGPCALWRGCWVVADE